MGWTRILGTVMSEERSRKRRTSYMWGGRQWITEMQRDEKIERTIFQL